jgi:hypothetical protein
MSDEEKQESGGKPDPRESSAFKAVVKQLDEQRRANQDMQAQLAALAAEREQSKLALERKSLEDKGQYEAALSKAESDWRTKLAEREAALESLRRDHEVASVALGLAGAGVAGKARDYLARDYAALGPDRPALEEWIGQIRQSPDYAVFFGSQQAAVQRPSNDAGRAAGSGAGKTDWAQVRADIRSADPRKSGPASKLMADYIRNNRGNAPPTE